MITLKNKIEIGVFIVLITLLGTFFHLYKVNKAEAERQSSNVSNLTKNIDQKNMVLDLTYKEFGQAKTKWSIKIDSLTKANKIGIKSVVTATIVHTEYKDTGSVKIVYKEAKESAKNKFEIEFAHADSCWGVKGKILTSDKDAKIDITERTSNNSAQLLITRKRFLGFLWWTKKTQFQAFTDCGKIDFTKIDFK